RLVEVRSVGEEIAEMHDLRAPVRERREVEVRRLVLLDEDHDADRSTLCRSGHGEELTEPTAARVAAAPPARGSAARSGPDDSQVDQNDALPLQQTPELPHLLLQLAAPPLQPEAMHAAH